MAGTGKRVEILLSGENCLRLLILMEIRVLFGGASLRKPKILNQRKIGQEGRLSVFHVILRPS